MREIKFRVWDKVSKKYREFDGMHDTMMTINEDGKVEYYNLQNGSGGDEYILEQFTGLHDKNGVEIFEGDVVKWENKRIGSYLAGKICFMESEWQVKGHSVSRLNLFRGIGEVIGNIHDNPELVEVKYNGTI